MKRDTVDFCLTKSRQLEDYVPSESSPHRYFIASYTLTSYLIMVCQIHLLKTPLYFSIHDVIVSKSNSTVQCDCSIRVTAVLELFGKSLFRIFIVLEMNDVITIAQWKNP